MEELPPSYVSRPPGRDTVVWSSRRHHWRPSVTYNQHSRYCPDIPFIGHSAAVRRGHWAEGERSVSPAYLARVAERHVTASRDAGFRDDLPNRDYASGRQRVFTERLPIWHVLTAIENLANHVEVCDVWRGNAVG